MKQPVLILGIALASLVAAPGMGVAGAPAPPTVPAGKPTAPVSVERSGSGHLALNVATRIELRYRAAANRAFSVEYRAEEGLQLLSPTSVQPVADAQGMATDMPVVQADRQGVHYLNAFITLDGRTRAVSIRLTAGEARPVRKPTGTVQNRPDGDALVILPADGGRRP